MEELNLSEQMSINGGGINASMVWYNLYGAFAKHGCAYPVGYKSTWKERIEPSVKVASQIARALDNCIYKIFDLDETGEYLCTGCECDNRQ